MKYALSNPVSRLLDKEPDQFTREDLITVIERKEIERITFNYVGIDGKLKELKIPITNRKHAEQVLAMGERVDGSSLFKGLVDTGVSDLYVVPRYETAFINPFDETSLNLVCRYRLPDGSPAPFTFDNIIDSTYEAFKSATGMEFHAFGELEFYLFLPPDETGFFSQKQSAYHNSSPFSRSGEILNEMVKHISHITGAVKYAHSEVGYIQPMEFPVPELSGKIGEQLEVEFLPRPANRMADYLVLSKWVIRNTAFMYGLPITFTPKLLPHYAGNGMHIHMEVVKNGKNMMIGDEGKLSHVARQIIGGLCRFAPSLTTFGNTIASSYLRLVPEQEAPTYICWSDLNRSAMIRVPLAWNQVEDLSLSVNPQQKAEYHADFSKQTVELRTPDGSAFIHLTLAGMIMAAKWAIENEKRAMEYADKCYVKGNIFSDAEKLKTLAVLPSSCYESAEFLTQKRTDYEPYIPASMIDFLINKLRAEDDENLSKELKSLPEMDREELLKQVLFRDLHSH